MLEQVQIAALLTRAAQIAMSSLVVALARRWLVWCGRGSLPDTLIRVLV